MRPNRKGRDAAAEGPRFVFVVTYARSGSTLLQAILNACPGVAIRGENHNALYHLFRSIRALEETRNLHGLHPQSGQPDNPWAGANAVQLEAYETRVVQSFVNRVLTPAEGTRVTGFKEIRYNRSFIAEPDFAPYMTFLLSRFRDARIVFNMRRDTDVAKSSFVAGQNPAEVRAWVANADARFTRFAATTDRAMLMRYEDWVKDQGLVHAMLDFLGLDWTEEAVRQVMARPLTHARA